MHSTLALAVTESSQVGEARRLAMALAARLDFAETQKGKLALVVTELATNLVRHAVRGELLLRALAASDQVGIEVLSLDRGPGMGSVEQCLEDGYSTGGTAGCGLGAIRRLADHFAVHSAPTGTALVVRVWQTVAPAYGPRPASGAIPACGVSVALAGEDICGDAWDFLNRPDGPRVLVADGLGHGPDAAAAAGEAVRIFAAHPGLRLPDLMETTHSGLRATRGAAVALLEVDWSTETARFVGVGNISGVIVAPDNTTQSLVSQNGTVGYQLRKISEFVYPVRRGSVIILHSDGLTGRWRLDGYPALIHRDPALIAGILYRDFQRGRDDVTVVALREDGEGRGL